MPTATPSSCVTEQGAVIASFAERRADIARQLKRPQDKVGGGVRAHRTMRCWTK